MYRAASLQTSNGFFCSVNHLSGGGVNANHNAKYSPQPRSQSSSAISDVKSPVKLVGKIRLSPIALGSKPPLVTRIARTGLGTRLHSPILACKNKTENDSRLLKNSEGNRDDEWTFCRGQETRIRNDQKNLRRKLVDYCPKQGDHKQRTLKHRNKQSGSKWTNYK